VRELFVMASESQARNLNCSVQHEMRWAWCGRPIRIQGYGGGVEVSFFDPGVAGGQRIRMIDQPLATDAELFDGLE
jgi:hypothetical protein